MTDHVSAPSFQHGKKSENDSNSGNDGNNGNNNHEDHFNGNKLGVTVITFVIIILLYWISRKKYKRKQANKMRFVIGKLPQDSVPCRKEKHGHLVVDSEECERKSIRISHSRSLSVSNSSDHASASDKLTESPGSDQSKNKIKKAAGKTRRKELSVLSKISEKSEVTKTSSLNTETTGTNSDKSSLIRTRLRSQSFDDLSHLCP